LQWNQKQINFFFFLPRSENAFSEIEALFDLLVSVLFIQLQNLVCFSHLQCIVTLNSWMIMLLASFYYFFFCWIVYVGAFTSSTSFPKQSRLFSTSSITSTSLSATNNKPHLQEGDRVPSVTFKARVRDDSITQPNPYKWKDVNSDELFLGKRCVLFALPGGITLIIRARFANCTFV
jgi:hypothetical protein